MLFINNKTGVLWSTTEAAFAAAVTAAQAAPNFERAVRAALKNGAARPLVQLATRQRLRRGQLPLVQVTSPCGAAMHITPRVGVIVTP